MIKSKPSVNLQDLDPEVVYIVEEIEQYLDRELIVTSGYRDRNHPVEINKVNPGEHTMGLAIDVWCDSPSEFMDVVAAACHFGVRRIGISRKKGKSSGFVHLGFDTTRPKSIWLY